MKQHGCAISHKHAPDPKPKRTEIHLTHFKVVNDTPNYPPKKHTRFHDTKHLAASDILLEQLFRYSRR